MSCRGLVRFALWSALLPGAAALLEGRALAEEREPRAPAALLPLALDRDAEAPFGREEDSGAARLPPLRTSPETPGALIPPEPSDSGVASLKDREADAGESKGSKDPLKDFARRVADLEKMLKQRDEDDKKPKAEKYPTVNVTGFLQLDTVWYTQDAVNRQTVGDAQDGLGFRRARLAVNGKVAEFTGYQLEVDFAASGRPSFFDCYLDQGNIPVLGDVRVGHFLQPFSVDAYSGFRNLMFLERSLPFLAFVPFRRVGIMASNSTEDRMTNWAYSGYRTGAFNNLPLGDDRFATDLGDVGGWSFSTRVTHLLWYDEPAEGRYLWHVGFSYNYSQLGADDAKGSGTVGNIGSPLPFYQARTTPEFGPLGFPEFSQNFGVASNATPTFVDTGRYQADNFNLFGVETAAQYGPWSAQSEFMATLVNSIVGPVYYSGAYGQVAYRLTGESRTYDKKTASFGNVLPYTNFIPLGKQGIAGWGAWEIAARWSYVNLMNPDTLEGHYYNSTTNTFNARTSLANGIGAAGNGFLQDTTLGFTWFMTAHSKLQFNWIHAMLDNKFRGSSMADLWTTRVQVDF